MDKATERATRRMIDQDRKKQLTSTNRFKVAWQLWRRKQVRSEAWPVLTGKLKLADWEIDLLLSTRKK